MKQQEIKEVTLEELSELLKEQEGEFIICVKPGEEEKHGDESSLSA